MPKLFKRLVVWGGLLGGLYLGYQWWTQPEEETLIPGVVSKIVRGNSDGSETILWSRKR